MPPCAFAAHFGETPPERCGNCDTCGEPPKLFDGTIAAQKAHRFHEREHAMAHDFTELRQRYLAAQLGGNRREALRLVIDEGIGRGASPLEVQLEVIQAAQREIGRLWEESAISIAHEHMATAISNTALAHLYDCSPRAPSNGKKVIVACVDGELHDFPARLVSDALDLAGFDVRYLGASVPADDIVALIAEERPDRERHAIAVLGRPQRAVVLDVAIDAMPVLGPELRLERRHLPAHEVEDAAARAADTDKGTAPVAVAATVTSKRKKRMYLSEYDITNPVTATLVASASTWAGPSNRFSGYSGSPERCAATATVPSAAPPNCPMRSASRSTYSTDSL